jgi:hypothetical protein
MGLDMYLSKKTYVKQWDHQSPEEKYDVVVTKGGNVVEGIKASRVKYIEEEIGYWRKANAIHKWFVDNVQEGKDDCGDYYVGDDDLQNLLDICKKVTADNSLAESLLPCQSGFFFGGTEYDEWYFKDISNTITILEEALVVKGGEIYYSSSW